MESTQRALLKKHMHEIDPNEKSKEAINELIKVVSRLRDPVNGCPWDQKQNHESLIPYAIEEAHEVADAIRFGTDENLCDELGDLLLQVIFHAQIANEEQRFGLEDIASAATAKMIRRHPHIFNKAERKSVKEVELSWEKIKKIERQSKESNITFSKVLSNKVRSQSPLRGSMYIVDKILKKSNKCNQVVDPFAKISLYLDLVKDSIKEKDDTDKENIIGDLLFITTYIGMLCSLNPEEALRKSNKKFLKKISFIEKRVNGLDLTSVSITKLRLLWEKAENIIKDKYPEDSNFELE